MPDQVVELGKKKGEGLEAWGRASPRLPTATKRLDGSAPETSGNESKAGNRPCKVGTLTVADDVTKIVDDLSRRGPLICRKKGSKRAVLGLVVIKVEGTDPLTQPKRTRKLLAAGLKDYAAQLTPDTTGEPLKKATSRDIEVMPAPLMRRMLDFVQSGEAER